MDMSANEGWRSEQELVKACLAGDVRATHRLVATFHREVYALCLRLLGHTHDAEDVTQEVFLRIFRSLRSWDGKRPLRPWILAIAVNRCRTWLRKRPRNNALPDELSTGQGGGETDTAWELQETLSQALASLREEYRTVFVLYHDRHLAYEEIAEVVGRPVGTVKTWLHRARLEILAYLRRWGWDHEIRAALSGLPELDANPAG